MTTERELIRQARVLCDWIGETPHQRGSINGAAAQLAYAIEAHLSTAQPTAPAGDAMDASAQNGLAWAVSCWQGEVANRPLVNVHRRTLDDTWRQVIRYFGGDPDKLLGPCHSALLASQPAQMEKSHE